MQRWKNTFKNQKGRLLGLIWQWVGVIQKDAELWSSELRFTGGRASQVTGKKGEDKHFLQGVRAKMTEKQGNKGFKGEVLRLVIKGPRWKGQEPRGSLVNKRGKRGLRRALTLRNCILLLKTCDC